MTETEIYHCKHWIRWRTAIWQ